MLRVNEYEIDGYKFEYTNLDNDNATRGIGLYIKKSLTYSIVDLPRITTTSMPNEVMGVEIYLENKQKMLVLTIYRSPSSDIIEDKAVNEFVKKIGELKYQHIVLVGDFNHPISSSCDKEMEFIDACQESLLTQHVLTPTRRRGSDNPSLVDLFLATNEDNVENVETKAPLGKSDHSVVAVAYRSEKERNVIKRKMHYEKGNYERMKDILNVDWELLLENCNDNIDCMWEKFVCKYKMAEQECVPVRIIDDEKKRDSQTLHRSVRSKLKKKSRLWKRYKESKDMTVYQQYCKCRNQVQYKTRKAEKLKGQNIAKHAR